MEGKVKFFNENKGYGFIKEDTSDKDIFFHSSGLIEQVRKDDMVQFTIEDGKKGKKAVNIKKV